MVLLFKISPKTNTIQKYDLRFNKLYFINILFSENPKKDENQRLKHQYDYY